MPNGFFSGGMAEGMLNADKQALDRERLTSDTSLRSRALDQSEAQHKAEIGLRSRALDLSERAQKRADSQAAIAEANNRITETMQIVSETIKGGVQAGRDPAMIEAAVAPLLSSAQSIATKIGRDPNALSAMVKAQLTQPTPAQVGTAAGQTKGALAVAENKVKTEGGLNTNALSDPNEIVKAEATLRDDFTKAAQPFTIIRDAMNRISSVKDTGAGDIALVFQYMKILDPGSTVREGEFATASNAAGVPSSIIGQYNKLIGGGTLAPKARKEIKDQAVSLYKAQEQQFETMKGSYKGIAGRLGLNHQNILVNSENAAVPKGPPPPPPGFVIPQ